MHPFEKALWELLEDKGFNQQDFEESIKLILNRKIEPGLLAKNEGIGFISHALRSWKIKAAEKLFNLFVELGKKDRRYIEALFEENNKSSLFHFAAKYGSLFIVQELLKIAGEKNRDFLINGVDEQGFTPLYHAVMMNQQSIIDYLLANNADIQILNENGCSVISVAAFANNITAMEKLLAHPQAGLIINFPDIEGNTPLHKTCNKSDGEIVALLLSHGANLQFKNIKKQTPLMRVLEEKENSNANKKSILNEINKYGMFIGANFTKSQFDKFVEIVGNLDASLFLLGARVAEKVDERIAALDFTAMIDEFIDLIDECEKNEKQNFLVTAELSVKKRQVKSIKERYDLLLQENKKHFIKQADKEMVALIKFKNYQHNKITLRRRLLNLLDSPTFAKKVQAKMTPAIEAELPRLLSGVPELANTHFYKKNLNDSFEVVCVDNKATLSRYEQSKALIDVKRKLAILVQQLQENVNKYKPPAENCSITMLITLIVGLMSILFGAVFAGLFTDLYLDFEHDSELGIMSFGYVALGIGLILLGIVIINSINNCLKTYNLAQELLLVCNEKIENYLQQLEEIKNFIEVKNPFYLSFVNLIGKLRNEKDFPELIKFLKGDGNRALQGLAEKHNAVGQLSNFSLVASNDKNVTREAFDIAINEEVGEETPLLRWHKKG